MKKIILLLTLSIYSLFAGNIPVKVRIIEKISLALVKKLPINILVQENENISLLKNSKILNQVHSCEKADMILIKKENKYTSCKIPPLIFATSYLGFKNSPSAIGAFFYQKGRPNIILKKDKLDKYNIKLSEEFDKYIE